MTPGPIRNETSDTATSSPNHFDTSVTSMVAAAPSAGFGSAGPVAASGSGTLIG